jgi:hypothetical protein
LLMATVNPKMSIPKNKKAMIIAAITDSAPDLLVVNLKISRQDNRISKGVNDSIVCIRKGPF